MVVKKMKEYIFIDTNIFVEDRFNINSPAFKLLQRHVNDGSYNVISNSIAEGEQKKHLLNFRDEVLSDFSRIYKHKFIMRNVNLFNGNSIEEEKSIFKNKIDEAYIIPFYDYLKSLEIINIPLTKDTEFIFQMYFANKAPFETKMQKKSEFPDAFMVKSIFEWAKKNRVKVNTISNDKGFEKMVEKYECITNFISISEFLMDYTSKNESNLFSFLDVVLENNVEFENCLFMSIDFETIIEQTLELSTEDNYTSFDDFEIINIDYDLLNINYEILNIEKKKNIILCEVLYFFDLKINGKYELEDFSNGIYDNEEKKYLFVPVEEFNFNVSPTLSFYITIELPSKIKDIYEARKKINEYVFEYIRGFEKIYIEDMDEY